MLKIKNLTKIYLPKKGEPVEALSHATVDFGNTGLVFLLGKSGSGKSTMLNLIGGLDQPTGGEIIVKGKSSSSFSESDFDSYRNTYVGFVFQEYNLIDGYTVGVNVGLALELQGKNSDRAAVDEILRKVELVDGGGETLFGRRIGELSGGQRQRVAIARALVKNPEIILADEPTGALDSKTGRKFYELLKELSKEKLIIVVTHDRENANKYGDRIIELADGVIISDTASETVSEAEPGNKNDKEAGGFIKSKLPFKRAFTIGAGALKAKPVRLIMSIFLSIISFVVFGFSLTARAVRELDVEIQTAHDYGSGMITVSACVLDESGKPMEDKPLSKKQLKTLKEYNNGVDPVFVFDTMNMGGQPYNTQLRESMGEISIEEAKEGAYLYGSPYDYFGTSSLRFLAELDPATGENDAKLSPDARLTGLARCRLPETPDEIAITDLTADMFLYRGYKEADGTITAINSPDELIGKKIGKLTVTGIYSTEQDIQEYRELSINRNEDNVAYTDARMRGAWESSITFGYVCRGFTDSFPHLIPQYKALIALPESPAVTRALINDLTYQIGPASYTSVTIKSEYSGLVSAVSFLYGDIFLSVLTFVIVIFTIFAILLTMNFLSVSMSARKKQLGILRALGARKKDTATICLAESLLLAAINTVLSLAGIFIICGVLNSVLFVPIFIVGFPQIAAMLLLTFGVSALATVQPVGRLSKKKPIDVINDK